MHEFRSIFVASVGLILAACGGGDADPKTPAIISPTQSDIPVPNHLLMLGSTDGTVNIPMADPNDTADPTFGINEQDGFSTMAPMLVGVEEEVDGSTVEAGRTVRMYEMIFDPAVGAATGVASELSAGEFRTAMLPTQ